MKFGIKHYFAPTPKRLRVLGDSLVAAGTLGSSMAIMNGHETMGVVVIVLSVAGKFLSNFFTDEQKAE
jgi:hypothetical protein